MDNIRIISPGTNAKALASFNENFKQMVAAYTRLPFHLGEEAIPLNPKEIDAARFKVYVEKMTRGLNEDQKIVWKKLYEDATMQIKVICRFFVLFPDAEFAIDPNINKPRENRLTCINKKDVINKAAEVDIPESCKEYFEKILSLRNSLDEMREYEKTHNIQKHSIEEMIYYASHDHEYAGKWVDGYFEKKNN